MVLNKNDTANNTDFHSNLNIRKQYEQVIAFVVKTPPHCIIPK